MPKPDSDFKITFALIGVFFLTAELWIVIILISGMYGPFVTK